MDVFAYMRKDIAHCKRYVLQVGWILEKVLCFSNELRYTSAYEARITADAETKEKLEIERK